MKSMNELIEAFEDYESPYHLYRATYKHTDCGLSVGFHGSVMVYEDNGESGPGNPGDQRESFAYYCDDLKKLSSFESMREWAGDLVVDSISVSSIVEGVDQCTDTHWIVVHDEGSVMTNLLPFRMLSTKGMKTAEQIRDDYWTAVHQVNEEAQAIWDETHGCEKCAELMDYVEWMPGETPCRTDCPECQGYGVAI